MDKFYHAGKSRFYGLQHKNGTKYCPETGFNVMTHKEACTMKSKQRNPNDWELIELTINQLIN